MKYSNYLSTTANRRFAECLCTGKDVLSIQEMKCQAVRKDRSTLQFLPFLPCHCLYLVSCFQQNGEDDKPTVLHQRRGTNAQDMIHQLPNLSEFWE